MKHVSFLGDSLEVVREFPQGARREAGFQIRVTDPTGAFRVLYTTVVGDAVYVLHAFQKKSQATAKRDLVLATARYAQLKRSRL